MKKILLFFVIIFLFAGCSDDDRIIIHVVDEMEMFPLDVGNEWQFLRKDIDSLGLVSDSTDTLGYTVMERLSGELYEYYSIEVTSSAFSSSSFLYLKNNSSGVWQLNDQVTPYSSSHFLQFPAEAGDSYLWGSNDVTVLSVDTSITVPAGTFECYHYLVENGDTTLADYSSVSNLFYTPDIGFISSNSFTFQNGLRISGSLQQLYAVSLNH